MATDKSILLTGSMISVEGAARLKRNDDTRDVVLDVATDGNTINVINGRLYANPNSMLPETLSFTYSDLKRTTRQLAGVNFVRYTYRFDTLRMFELLEQTIDGPIVIAPQKVMRSIDGDYTEIIWEFTEEEDRQNTAFRKTQWYVLFGRNGTAVTPPPVEPDEPDNPPDEPVVGTTVYYGCVNDGVTYRVSDLTEDVITSLQHFELGTVDSVTVTATTGGVYFIAVPEGYYALKDDGVGGQIVFDENLGIDGTGANGLSKVINGASYKLYGEFSLIDCLNTLYIIEG